MCILRPQELIEKPGQEASCCLSARNDEKRTIDNDLVQAESAGFLLFHEVVKKVFVLAVGLLQTPVLDS